MLCNTYDIRESIDVIQKTFSTRPGCDGSVYLASYCEYEESDLAATAGTGEAARMDGHLVCAYEHGLCDEEFGNWKVDFAIVDLHNSAEYMKHRLNNIPTLLRHTKLWDLVANRPVPVVAHWLFQGWAHPAAAGGSRQVRQRLPFARSLMDGDVPVPVQRCLTGNGMHFAQVGIWFLHCFAGSELCGRDGAST